jgi:hypothetical protein
MLVSRSSSSWPGLRAGCSFCWRQRRSDRHAAVSAKPSGQTGAMAKTAPSEVKLHRREIMLDRKSYTVLSPRPTTPFRFATNLYHDTWHVLSDARGAHLLGRMFWSMAYQRRPNTIMVIDYPLLVPNPFDADPSSPILISNTNLGGLSKTAVTQLNQNLPFTSRSLGIVRLATPGLARLLAGQTDLERTQRDSGDSWTAYERAGFTDRVKGVVVLAAAPPMLEWWALWLSRLGTRPYEGSDYSELGHSANRGWHRDAGTGEVQIFERFSTMVSQAAETRKRLYPNAGNRELLQNEREAVWAALPTREPR